jgi:hypothetical protein
MCALLADLFNVHQSIQTVESSAREFLGKDKSTTLMASVVSRYHSLISSRNVLKNCKHNLLFPCRALLIWREVSVHLRRCQLALG